ncbi:MarR family winged helix-turn-helix transcriptional regulator [Anaerostipes sp.]|uniref:MarR family winged helix-turn-helix transcriptional regulator n=1 Tax=Anaerostipes sp. TaxID=1872530 RepID=UPI0025C0F17F|nr:MarR family transcriptional regulator [Anaerostipes sp.]MBS7009618.1 MarR family transcriptional regulator [Anaerostipes sp.]
MELNQCINYLLTTAQHAVFQEMSSQLAKYDVTPVQYGVMYCLWVKKKNSPKEIAEELKLENSTISGVLERMEKKGLIKRKVSKEDRRFVEIVLTDKGNDLEEPILDTVDEVNRIVLKDMGQQEQEALKASLRHLAGINE